MRFFGRAKKQAVPPSWALGICPVPWIEDHEELIDGVRVEFQKTGWSWTVLRDDLPVGRGWLVESGPADSKEEALEIGMEKLREHQAALA